MTYMFPIKPASYDRGYELEWMSHFVDGLYCMLSTYKLRTYDNVLSIYNLSRKGRQLPLESGPAFAMERRPGVVCLSLLCGTCQRQDVKYREAQHAQILIGEAVTVDRLYEICECMI